MSTFISKYFGRAWEDRTPTNGFEDRYDIHFTKARSVFIGPASRNRTHILEVEALCIIHYTIARYLVPFPRLERGTHSFWESRVYQLRQKGMKENSQGTLCEQVWEP